MTHILCCLLLPGALAIGSTSFSKTTDTATVKTLYCFEGCMVLPLMLEWTENKPPIIEQPGFLPHRKGKSYTIESTSPLQPGEYELDIRSAAGNQRAELHLLIVVKEARIENREEIELRFINIYFGSMFSFEALTPDTQNIPNEQFISKVIIDSSIITEQRGRNVELLLSDTMRSIEYSSLIWENPVSKERIVLFSEPLYAELTQAPPVINVHEVEVYRQVPTTKSEKAEYQMKLHISNIYIQSSRKGNGGKSTDVDICDVQAGIQKSDVGSSTGTYSVKCMGIRKVDAQYEVELHLFGPTPRKGKVEGSIIIYVKARAKNKRNGRLSNTAGATFSVWARY